MPHPKRPADNRRSPCPVAGTLDLLGDRWTLLVVRDLFAGKTQFKHLAASPEKIATNILTDRLNRLLDAGVVDREPLAEHQGRFAYTLTDKGRSLGPVLKAVADWGLEHIEGTEARIKIPPRNPQKKR